MKSTHHYVTYSLSSALLLTLSWYWNLSICLFFALIPLLVLEDKLSQKTSGAKSQLQLFLYSYLTFFIWNIGVTWWVVYASAGGAALAFILNALLMTGVFIFYSVIRNRLNKSWSAWMLIPIWLAWEHGHTLWDLSWTWLTLGNVFAFHPNWIQWYEYTGTSGGSVWVIAVNVLGFLTIKNYKSLRLSSALVLKLASSVILPVLISYCLIFLKKFQQASSQTIKTVIVQPNIDPYTTKFTLNYFSQFNAMLNQIKGKVNDSTKYLILPETFITDQINEAEIAGNSAIQLFRDSLLSYFPRLKIVTGANTYVFYEDKKLISSTAREHKQSGLFYDVYNSAIFISAQSVQIYHKSKLVPGVERMPFPALLKPLENLAIDMGGTMGSLGIQNERTVFKNSEEDVAIAPVICYESVYADFMTEYMRKGAELIFIITNDGWWENTPGYKQHLNYARLRAVENRRSIARCANTGISCFIDEYGQIDDKTEWWETAVIEKNLPTNSNLTFFSRYGDLLSYLSVTVTGVCLIWLLFLRFKK